MLNDSILGTAYVYWINSYIFSLIHRAFLPFSRAFSNSRIVHYFERESKFQIAYENSFVARIFILIFDALLYFPRKIYLVLQPAIENSYFLKLASGSLVLNYEFVFYGFIAVIFMCPHNYWSNSYALLGSFAIFILYLIQVAMNKRELLYPQALGFPFLLFVISCFLSLMFTQDLSDSIRVLMFFIAAFMLFYLIVASIDSLDRLKKLLGFIYVSVVFTGIYGVVQGIMGVEVDALLTDLTTNVGVPGRVYSTLDNPNNYAEFLVLLVPLSAAYAMHAKKAWQRFILSAGLAFPMLAMVMTYSRSGWISIAVACVIFIYYANKKIIPIGIILAILCIPFLPSSVMTRIATIFSGSDTSTAHRFYLWRGIILLLQDNFHWLTGIGIGPNTFNEVYPTYARLWATEGVYHSQMQYMELMMEFGLLGFISFFWMIAKLTKDAAFKIYKTSDAFHRLALIACVSSIVGMLLTFLVEYIWYYPRVLFAYFILLAICVVCINLGPVIKEDRKNAKLKD